MEYNTFTTSAQDLIHGAVTKARDAGHAQVAPLHLLAASCSHELCERVYRAMDVAPQHLFQLIQKELDQMPTTSGGSLTAHTDFQSILSQAAEYARAMEDAYTGVEHILYAMSDYKKFPRTVTTYLQSTQFTRKQVEKIMSEKRNGKNIQSQSDEKQYDVLEKYCKNITHQAREGKLDPVIGRHDEVRRVIQILSRRTKNNPVLVGEPGVGKTAVVEGIAQRIVDDDVPQALKDSTIYSLDLGLLLAGTKYQGEFEERIKAILKAIEEQNNNVMMFIDELHMLVGAGASGSGGMDASNLLKPALARGTLHCIGATTLVEYKKHIEKDAALERRFQKVLVEEPTTDDALSILRGLKERYELHHGIRIKDQALVAAVNLSTQHIADRFLPDKAIDLVDEAASMVKMAMDSHPEQIDQLERKIRQLNIEKVALEKEDDEASQKRLEELTQELKEAQQKHDDLIKQWEAEKAPLKRLNELKEQIEQAQHAYAEAEREGDYARASEIKYGKLTQLRNEYAEVEQELHANTPHMIKNYVDEHDIASVVARWTGIPVEKLAKDEQEKILGMKDALQERVIGQKNALERITSAIQMHRAGLTDPHRPIGSFLFLGPTGVGKTEVAKTLADFLFDDETKMIRIDMSEYMERHAVARLIGSPPGYVGYEEGGQLTEAVRKHPFSVVLFDEIEKAHSDVFNIFLQILDEGHITDSQGRTVSFKNTIIIMTSNIGSDLILQAESIDERIQQEVKSLLRQTFRPEFLNRIDTVTFFERLTQDDVAQIAHLQIQEVQNRLARQEKSLHVEDEVFELLARKGYEPELGARPLKRVIQQHVLIPISRYILAHPDASSLTVGVQNDEIYVH